MSGAASLHVLSLFLFFFLLSLNAKHEAVENKLFIKKYFHPGYFCATHFYLCTYYLIICAFGEKGACLIHKKKKKLPKLMCNEILMLLTHIEIIHIFASQ